MIKVGAAVGFGALFGLGVMNSAGKSVKEGMMEAAFGRPDADRAFLGTELSGRFLAGSILGGPVGGLMRASAPMDYLRTNPVAPTARMQLGSTLAGGVVGGAIGGFGFGKKFGVMGAIGEQHWEPQHHLDIRQEEYKIIKIFILKAPMQDQDSWQMS